MASEGTSAEGLLRLDALVSPDLHKYIDPMSRPAQVGWGAFFTVLHQVRAVLALHREGACFAAGPNRRTIVEYTLFLLWLSDDGEGAVAAINRNLQNGQKLLATQLRGTPMMDSFPAEKVETFRATIAEPLAPHPDERLVKPLQLIDKYDPTLKPYYAVESRFSHVSLTSMEFFFKDAGNAIGLSQVPDPEEPISCQPLLLHLLFRAASSFNSLMTGTPWTEELADIASRYDISNPN